MTAPIMGPSPAPDPAPAAPGRSARNSRPSPKDLRTAQPAPMSEGYIGLVYRQLSLPLSWLLVQTRISANQVSILWVLLGLVASACFATGTYGWDVLGALLLQLVAILDRVDGEIARYKNTQSMLGVFWDLAGHIVIKSFLFVGISLGVFRNHSNLAVIIFGVSATSSLIIGLNLRLYQKYILLKNNIHGPRRAAARSLLHKSFKKLEHIWWTLGLFGIILAGALLNQLYYVLLFYGVATPVWALSVLIRVAHEIQAEDTHHSRNS